MLQHPSDEVHFTVPRLRENTLRTPCDSGILITHLKHVKRMYNSHAYFFCQNQAFKAVTTRMAFFGDSSFCPNTLRSLYEVRCRSVHITINNLRAEYDACKSCVDLGGRQIPGTFFVERSDLRL